MTGERKTFVERAWPEGNPFTVKVVVDPEPWGAGLLDWMERVAGPDPYPPGYDGPLDERTPGFFRIPNIERDRERLIDEARD